MADCIFVRKTDFGLLVGFGLENVVVFGVVVRDF